MKWWASERDEFGFRSVFRREAEADIRLGRIEEIEGTVTAQSVSGAVEDFETIKAAIRWLDSLLPQVEKTSLSRFDRAAALRSKREAIERVDHNASEDWKKSALESVVRCAKRQDEFTTDAVWQDLEDRGIVYVRERRVMGAIMQRAAKDGFVEPTEKYVDGTSKISHARPIRVWRSLILG